MRFTIYVITNMPLTLHKIKRNSTLISALPFAITINLPYLCEQNNQKSVAGYEKVEF